MRLVTSVNTGCAHSCLAAVQLAAIRPGLLVTQCWRAQCLPRLSMPPPLVRVWFVLIAAVLLGCATRGDQPDWLSMAPRAGVELKARNERCRTPLPMHAARVKRNPGVIEALINSGTDLEARDERTCTPPMHAADWILNRAVARALLEAGADMSAHDDIGRTPLMHAAQRTRNPGWCKCYMTPPLIRSRPIGSSSAGSITRAGTIT